MKALLIAILILNILSCDDRPAESSNAFSSELDASRRVTDIDLVFANWITTQAQALWTIESIDQKLNSNLKNLTLEEIIEAQKNNLKILESIGSVESESGLKRWTNFQIEAYNILRKGLGEANTGAEKSAREIMESQLHDIKSLLSKQKELARVAGNGTPNRVKLRAE